VIRDDGDDDRADGSQADAARPRRRRSGDTGPERDRAWSGRRLAERAVLVGIVLPHGSRGATEEHLNELELLARTAGAEPVGRLVQERSEVSVRTFIGKGKVDELATLCRQTEANLVLFDDTLAPAQARNLEAILDVNVIDRTELILDIFARHARTREAKMQVELAQLQYLRPRLKRLWDHLSRQSGGIGTRGPGETQLEVDRRRVGEKIAHLKEALRDRRTVAETQRKGRGGAFSAALVGYTNAGKSSLLNALAGTELLTENKLFSTLDATTRRVPLPRGDEVLLTDTVGFIRKLPHDLVASFRTTLEEINAADLVVHVADITSPSLEAHFETVHEVLDEILDGPRDSLLVLNKLDALADRGATATIVRRHPEAVLVSARTGEGLEDLRQRIQERLQRTTVELDIVLLRRQEQLVSYCYREGRVASHDQGEDGRQRLRVRFPGAALRRLQRQFTGDFEIADAVAPGGEAR
jgi:GTP-binding protein HflX